MKKLILAAVAVAFAAVATPAAAQDFTGPRAGVYGGYDDVASREGFTYGVVVGVDAPVVKGVTVGVEATLEDSTTDGAGVRLSRDLGLNLRAGVKVLPKAQVFAKVGYASTRFDFAGTSGGVALEGIRYGGGVEYAVTNKLYTTVEYRRTELENAAGAFAGRDGVLVGLGLRF